MGERFSRQMKFFHSKLEVTLYTGTLSYQLLFYEYEQQLWKIENVQLQIWLMVKGSNYLAIFFMTNPSKKFIETNDIIEKLFANQKKNMRGLRVFVYSY